MFNDRINSSVKQFINANIKKSIFEKHLMAQVNGNS